MATPDSIREAVVRLAQGRCEYCQCPERYSSTTFSVEHIMPRAKGGGDEIDNLAFACQGCNNRKYTATSHLDPVSGFEVPLYHPRRHGWSQHFAWSDDGKEMNGTTDVGRASVARMALNRTGVVALRELLIRSLLHPPPHFSTQP